MVWLPDGEKILKIRLPVLTQFTNVTDRQTDGQMPHGNVRTDATWWHKPRLHNITRQHTPVVCCDKVEHVQCTNY